MWFGEFCKYRFLSRKWYEIGSLLLRITNRKSQIADGSVSVPMTLSDLESRDARGQNFLADVHIYVRTVWPTMTKFGTVTLVGISFIFLAVGHVHVQSEPGPSVYQFFVTPNYAARFDLE